MDLSGLPETAVDSEEDDDEEDIERASDPLMSRDIVRDCLEKDPMDRTDDDIGETALYVVYALKKKKTLQTGFVSFTGKDNPRNQRRSVLFPTTRPKSVVSLYGFIFFRAVQGISYTHTDHIR